MNRVLGWFERLTSPWWFGQAVVIGTCAAILGLAMLMSPSPGMLTLFGHEIPVLCGFRRLTGIGCPGCGLTRSFVFLAHAQILDAFRMNVLGPPLFLVVLGQIPYRIYEIAKRRGAAQG